MKGILIAFIVLFYSNCYAWYIRDEDYNRYKVKERFGKLYLQDEDYNYYRIKPSYSGKWKVYDENGWDEYGVIKRGKVRWGEW